MWVHFYLSEAILQIQLVSTIWQTRFWFWSVLVPLIGPKNVRMTNGQKMSAWLSAICYSNANAISIPPDSQLFCALVMDSSSRNPSGHLRTDNVFYKSLERPTLVQKPSPFRLYLIINWVGTLGRGHLPQLAAFRSWSKFGFIIWEAPLDDWIRGSPAQSKRWTGRKWLPSANFQGVRSETLIF
jgi:hypothetical protein